MKTKSALFPALSIFILLSGQFLFIASPCGGGGGACCDLALNKTATASSIQCSGYEASKAVDGNTGTRWSSAFTDNGWIYVDLVDTFRVDSVVLKWENAYGMDYKIMVSRNASSWTEVAHISNGAVETRRISFAGQEARFVKMLGIQRGTGYGYSLWEFEVYGDSLKNHAPSNIVLSDTAVKEGKPAGTPVGKFTTTDPDTQDAHAYTLVSGTGSDDNASFTISGDSLKTAAVFNYASKSVYHLRVRTTDNGKGNLWYEKAFIIKVVENFSTWNHSKKITLNTGVSGANVSSAVFKFPVLVRLNENTFDFSQAKSGGVDIRFSKLDSAMTPISYEIERWDSAGKVAEIWVKLDTVRGNDNTQSFKILWGKTGVTSKSNPAKVFDTAAGFTGVWHLNNDPSGTAPQILDAVAGLNGTSAGSMISNDLVSGVVGKGIHFDGSNDRISFGNGSTVDITGHNSLTFAAWVKFNSMVSNSRYDIMKKGDHQYGLQKINATDNKVQFVVYDNYWQIAKSNADVDTANWFYFTGVYNGVNDSVFLYVNGVKQAIAAKASGGISNGRDDALELGRCSETQGGYFPGKLDETELSKTARSAAWIKLCYENQKPNQTLVNIEDTIPPAVAITSPANGFVTNHTPVAISWTVDGVAQTTQLTEPLTEGINKIVRTATDAAGNIGKDSVFVTLDTHPPVVAITSPANGIHTTIPYQTIVWTVDSVSYRKDTVLSAGQNTITRTATDAAGNIGSASVTVTLDPLPPCSKTVPPDSLIKPVAVESKHDTAAFSGAYRSGVWGKPSLPFYKVLFLLPPNANLDSVRVTLNNPVEQLLPGTFFVEPPHRIGNSGSYPPGIDTVSEKDTALYATNAFYPASYTVVTMGKMRQYKIAQVVVTPYRYNPVTGQLLKITGGSLSVYAPQVGGDSLHGVVRNAATEPRLTGIVANPEILATYGTAPAPQSLNAAPASMGATAMNTGAAPTFATGTGYAIITTSDWNTSGCAQTIRDFISHLQTKGATVYTLYLTRVSHDSASTKARADSIRSWLQKNYFTGNILYALLIGDPHPDSGDIPMVKCSGSPSDYYYSELDSLGGDPFGDVTVGRIPFDVIRDSALVTRYLTKVMNYEKATNTNGRRFALLPMIPVGFPTDSWVMGESIKNNVLIPAQWDYYRIYPEYDYAACARYRMMPTCGIEDGVADLNPLPDELESSYEKTVSAWNKNNPGLVLWYTHGSPTVAEDLMEIGHAAALNPQYPAMVFEGSCLNGEPHVRVNLPYSLLSSNAISAIAATTDASSTDIEKLEPEYAKRVMKNISTGDALIQAFDNVGDVEYFNLFGCPHVSLNVDTIDINAPSQPHNLQARSVSKSEIDLSWTGATGATGATGYIIERGGASATKDGGFAELASVSGGSTTTYSNTGLPAATKYKYRVRAVDSTYRSWYSNIDSSTTWADAGNQLPEIPDSIWADSGSHYVKVYWHSSARATSYHLKRSTLSSGPFVTVATTTGSQYTDINLTNNTTYYYVVSAVNDLGESANSAMVHATPASSGSIPAPINLRWDTTSVYFDLATEVFLRWDYFPPRYTITKFEIWRAEKTGTGYTSFSSIGTLGNDVSQFYEFGLENGVTYKYQVYACNGGLCSAPAEIEVTMHLGNAPADPDSVRAQALTPHMIRVSWQDTSKDTSRAATGFQVFYRQGHQGNFTKFYNDYNGSINSVTYDYASENTEYQFCVRAKHIKYEHLGPPGDDRIDTMILYSRFSDTITVTTPDFCAPIPTDLAATALSPSSVRLTWNDSSNNVMEFIIQRMNKNTDTAWSGVGSVGGTIHSFTDNGLNDTATYSYRVYAHCSGGGAYPYSNYAYIDVNIREKARPTELSAKALSITLVELDWKDNSAAETGFAIERSQGAYVADSPWTEIGRVGSNITSYQNAGLTPAVTYWYRVRALFTQGSGFSQYSDPVSITLGQALAPSNLSGVIVDSASIRLSWKDNSTGETEFAIEHSVGTNTTWTEIARVNSNVTGYLNTGLTKDTAYHYRVRALFSGGYASLYSNQFDITICAPPAPNVSYAYWLKPIVIQWNFSSNESGYRVMRATVSTGPFVTIHTVMVGDSTHIGHSYGGPCYQYFDSTGLIPNFTYYYQVCAYNLLGENCSATLSVKTLPAAPRNLVVAEVSDTQATLRWSPGPNGADGFGIYRAVGNGGFEQIVYDLTDTFYTDTGLYEGEAYKYYVTAYITNTYPNQSEPSDTVFIRHVLYVDNKLTTGDDNGTSWANAFRGSTALQKALGAAGLRYPTTGNESILWVAKADSGHPYLPSGNERYSNPRTRTFLLLPHVKLYGGFRGSDSGSSTETFADRDVKMNETILSGDFNGDDSAGYSNYSENTYTVVYGADSAVIDGFTIAHGCATDSSGAYTLGAGMYNGYVSPKIANCTFLENYAYLPDTNGTFGFGAGMANDYSNPIVSNCDFIGNYASGGGAILNTNSSPIINNCYFYHNWAEYGGGLFNAAAATNPPSIINCVFVANTGEFGGGGLRNICISPSMINCTMTENVSHYLDRISNVWLGTAIFNQCGVPMVDQVKIINCILWNNRNLNDTLGHTEIKNLGCPPEISYSDIQGSGGSGTAWNSSYGTDAGNNVDADPLFGINYHLSTIHSPCIDGGNDSRAPVKDKDGNPRTGAHSDIGAYEYQP